MDATELVYAGAVEQARMIRDGETSSREVVEATLERIEHLNPELNAYRVVFAERALAEADQADARQASGQDRPLLGVPVAIKDDADVAGEITAFGTAAYGEPKRADSDVVTRLRAAGAIVVGKTNVPELTMWPWTISTTWGATRNPWSTDRTTGGSSGGTAAAVATGMCGVALGSDGGGSIRLPAACCGLFGIKPQRDRVPLGPDHLDAWNGLSVYGPLARTVADAAAFLDATADGVPQGGYLSALEQPPGKLRVAISLKPPQGSLARLGADQRRAVEETADLLRSLGHEVIERQVELPATLTPSFMARYLKGLDHDSHTMPRRERLERNTRLFAKLGELMPDGWLEKARRSEPGFAQRLNSVFETADVVLMPTLIGKPPLINELAGRGPLMSLYRAANEVAYLSPWNVIGQPAASVPVGFDPAGLPLNVQLCGRAGDELTLLKLSAQIEQARPWADARPPVDAPAALATA